MTTLHVDLSHHWRGGQSQALLLMQELARHGHPAELIAVEGSPLAERARAAGIRVHAVPPAVSRLLAALWLTRLHSDLVHCHEAHGLTSAWLASFVRPLCFVVSRRVAYPLSGNWLARLRYARAARVIAVSQFVKQSVVDSGIPAHRIEVVFDGVELPELSREERPADENVIGCVGYLLPEKNQELLVRALPIVLERFPKCRLLLAGDGSCRGELERLAARLNVAAAMDFAGFVDDVAAVYRRLDVFVFPSLAEPLGSSLLAAMAWGLPVVALATGAVPEIVTHERNGLLIPRSDPHVLADAILRLLGDRSLRVRLGAAARETIEEGFSANRMMRESLNVYLSLLESRIRSQQARG